jgi:Beta-propeller repeat
LRITPRSTHWLIALTAARVMGAASLHASPGPAGRPRLSPLDGNRPPSMAFSTYFGGESWDWGNAVAVDADGNTYMTGFVEGNWWTSQAEAFVVKVDSAGALVWSVLLDGDGWDEGTSVAAGADGDVWVFGSTASSDFPLMDPWEILPTDRDRLFLARLSAAGTLEFSTVFEGAQRMGVQGMALDAAGNVYLGGGTSTPEGSRGSVLKIDPVSAQIAWSADVASPSCLYGSAPSGFTVDSSGRAYLAWPCQTARLQPSGSLDYVVPFGGSGIAADAAGNAYLLSTVVGPPPEWSDVLVRRLGPTGQPAGTFQLGGSWDDWGEAIATDPEGHVYVVGETQSGDFPLKDAVQPDCSGAEEWYQCWNIGFLTKIRPDTWDLVYSTFLGGGRTVVTHRDRTVAWGVAAGYGAAAVTGWTVEEDFMVVNAFQPLFGGDEDGFLVRIVANQPPDCSAAAAQPPALWPPNGQLTPVAIGGVTDPAGGPLTISVTAIRQDEPLSKKGQPDATGLGTSRPMLRASRAGNGDGRVYHITFTATDPAGAACTGTVTVCVPRDRGKNPACGDGGPTFTSTE